MAFGIAPDQPTSLSEDNLYFSQLEHSVKEEANLGFGDKRRDYIQGEGHITSPVRPCDAVPAKRNEKFVVGEIATAGGTGDIRYGVVTTTVLVAENSGMWAKPSTGGLRSSKPKTKAGCNNCK
jgi:hypothetical protein